ncbi:MULTISPECIES: NAD(P)-dependent oxidoreductase [unclassified Pseudoalteromonas]|uniref:NAD-dependent epimerase/dehydratase family protein n=1 Tax=unclassified Pseudoalteromonas TaxID=194690 RepID=UPI003328D00C
MNKVLLIGASGSLGKGITAEIYKKIKVTGTYNNTVIDNKNIDTVQLDITHRDSFQSLDTDYDSVILVAGSMPAAMEGYDQNKYFDVNVTGTLNVLEFCRINNIKKIIYIMTFSDVSGSFYTGVPIKESDQRTLTYTGDHAVYAISKVTACELVEHYHQEYGLQTMIFRIPTVYCCDDNVNYHVDGKPKTKAYMQMIRSVMHNQKLELWGELENAKDMPYIKDFARLILKAIEHPTAQGLFNAGTGNPVSLKEFADAIVDVFAEGDVVLEHKPEKPSQPNFTFDMSKTETTFDYKPQFGIKDLLIDIKENSPSSVFELTK